MGNTRPHASETIAVDQRQLRQRAAVYRLLGRLWLKEIDEQGLRDLRTPPLRTAFVAAGGALPPGDADGKTLEDLAVDYCQLFVGPSGHLPPHQSVWTEGQFQGEASVALQTQYRALKLPPPAGMADHLGELLNCMGVIIERLAEETSVTPSDLDAAGQFFNQRLGWTDKLCKLAAERAQSTFYRGVVSMTHDFLSEESAAWQAAD